MKFLSIIFCLLLFWNAQGATDEFAEELLIRSLPDGKLHAHFQFTIRSNSTNGNHFGLFPQSIGQTIQKFEVNEFHLSFTQGRWFSERWGYPIIAAPIGAELWTWFAPSSTNQDGSTERVSTLWKGLTHTLAGLFCASLEEMKETVSSTPIYSFFPEGQSNFFANTQQNPELLKYSTLPREAVCTENLTPWLKILPCKSKSGLGGLVNSLKLYGVHYHSMATHFRFICQNDANCDLPTMELTQTLSIVFDPQRNGRNQEWNFNTLFGRNGVALCPAASVSNIYVQTIGEDTKFTDQIKLDPSPQLHITTKQNTTLGVYDLIKFSKTKYEEILDQRSKANGTTSSLTRVPVFSLKGVPIANSKPAAPFLTQKGYPSFRSERYVTGWGHEFGGLSSHLENLDNSTLTVTYFDMIPWWLKLYFHTIKLTVNGTQISNPFQKFSRFQMIPSEDRSAPSVIEFTMDIDPHTEVEFSIQFDKAFLHWTEHPPDAHRGFDLGSAVISVNFPPNHSQLPFVGLEWSPVIYSHNKAVQPFRMYTQTHLIQLATPDFSMPYNVITLTGTVFALLFGSMLNIMIRRMRFLDRVNNEFVSRKPLARIFRKILEIVDENIENENNSNSNVNSVHSHND